MTEKESGEDRPSLAMPSLGLGRLRKRSRDLPEESPEPVATSDSTPATEPAHVDAVTEPLPAQGPAQEPAQRTAPAPRPVASAEPPAATSTAPLLFADEVSEHPRPPDEPDDQPVEESADDPSSSGWRSRVSLPAIGWMPAAVLTGAVVGVLTVGLTWASLRLCEVVQGTSSCGNPGFFLLLAIMIAMVLVGGALLGAFGVPDPGSTSFLGMGLVAVIALLFLGNLLFQWWMILAIPAAAMAAYALAHWVTTAFVDPVETNLHR